MTLPDTPSSLPSDGTSELPFETAELRDQLDKFLRHTWIDPTTGKNKQIGSYKWGVYAFFDYDKEPIYVGQTNEKLSTRIRRHLTNQRTDAVAMSVLDPYEVCYIEVWPKPEFEVNPPKNAKDILNSIEYAVYQDVLQRSTFNAVLNEKIPTPGSAVVSLPQSYRAKVVSDSVSALRDHPDLRLARRAATLANLARVIAERKVQKGLRQTLLTQANRIVALATRRVNSVSGDDADDD